ncbi:hypothetical protein LCGC14_0549810 [marine sediment metagenome]|uniref:Uncharacterized protein n=1 Tax=marine sediment metagenome TaxID=412755 RepID=A0A0F9RV42_9ZZZZ
MAGSYSHCCDVDGSFYHELIENLGDSYEACEHMHFMINWLANGDKFKIIQAEKAFYSGEYHEGPDNRIPVSQLVFDKMCDIVQSSDIRLDEAFKVEKEIA